LLLCPFMLPSDRKQDQLATTRQRPQLDGSPQRVRSMVVTGKPDVQLFLSRR
jgi:hypothetical protein